MDHRIMRWITDDFKPTYFSYLLRHLRYTIGEPFLQFTPAVSTLTPEATTRAVLPSLLTQLLWDSGIVFWSLCALVLAIATGRRNARLLSHGWVVNLLIATATAGTLITWTTTGYGSGSGELSRLFLPVAVMSRLAVLLELLLSIDALLGRRSSDPHSGPE